MSTERMKAVKPVMDLNFNITFTTDEPVNTQLASVLIFCGDDKTPLKVDDLVITDTGSGDNEYVVEVAEQFGKKFYDKTQKYRSYIGLHSEDGTKPERDDFVEVSMASLNPKTEPKPAAKVIKPKVDKDLKLRFFSDKGLKNPRAHLTVVAATSKAPLTTGSFEAKSTGKIEGAYEEYMVDLNSVLGRLFDREVKHSILVGASYEGSKAPEKDALVPANTTEIDPPVDLNLHMVPDFGAAWDDHPLAESYRTTILAVKKDGSERVLRKAEDQEEAGIEDLRDIDLSGLESDEEAVLRVQALDADSCIIPNVQGEGTIERFHLKKKGDKPHRRPKPSDTSDDTSGGGDDKPRGGGFPSKIELINNSSEKKSVAWAWVLIVAIAALCVYGCLGLYWSKNRANDEIVAELRREQHELTKRLRNQPAPKPEASQPVTISGNGTNLVASTIPENAKIDIHATNSFVMVGAANSGKVLINGRGHTPAPVVSTGTVKNPRGTAIPLLTDAEAHGTNCVRVKVVIDGKDEREYLYPSVDGWTVTFEDVHQSLDMIERTYRVLRDGEESWIPAQKYRKRDGFVQSLFIENNGSDKFCVTIVLTPRGM